MQTIKFRAWNKTTKQMTQDYAHIGRYGELFVSRYAPEAYSDKGRPDLILLQFTGLCDKNGKDIYEGDIIKNDNNFSCSTSYGDYADETPNKRQIVWSDEDACFKWDYLSPLIQGRGCSGLSLCKSNEKEFEVIDNIYENPNLLALPQKAE